MRGTLSHRAYAEIRTLVHDMFQTRMSDTSFTRDIEDRSHPTRPIVQIRGYKIYWPQKELHMRFDRHFEGHTLQVRGEDLVFVDPATTQGPSPP